MTQAQAGDLLRQWLYPAPVEPAATRAELAEVSARHLSFIETGRSRPSREMVLFLAEHLDVPLRDRNVLLLAGGYAPAYRERALTDPDLTP